VTQSDTGLIIQNQESGPAGLLGRWFESRGIRTTTHHTWIDDFDDFDDLPEPEKHQFVVVLGSVRSATKDQPKWIPDARQYIGRAATGGVPVFGICLGAQLLAQSLGGSVSVMPRPEIFWGNVETESTGFPDGPWIVWHNDAFSIPPGATELAHTECASLAFRKGPHLGIQFHAEATLEHAAIWAREERSNFERWQLDPGEVLNVDDQVRKDARAAADRLFDYWWREIVNGSS
jgi:GMP synthase (glutamine-hydrolysing)